MPRRPPSPVRLRHRTPRRDIDVVELIARCGYITQPAVAYGTCRGRTKSVVSEVLGRLKDRGLITVDKSHRTAVNILSITTAGQDLLLERKRLAPELIFVPSKPLSPSIFRHSLTIADCMAVLQHVQPKPTMLLTAPAIQRLMPGLDTVPDLLIGVRTRGGDGFVAMEIDCGTEGVAVLTEKFRRLPRTLATLAGASPVSIHVLTTDSARQRLIERLLDACPLLSLVQILPSSTGDPVALATLASHLGAA